MTPTEKTLAKALVSARRSAARWSKKVEILREKLIKSGKCSHFLKEPFDWEHDNGYGVQSKEKGERCTLCLGKIYYPGMSSRMVPLADQGAADV